MNREEEDKILERIFFENQIKTPQNNFPTVFSLQDIIDLIKKKYGNDWENNRLCKLVVIWNSRMYIEEHVKEIVPDLFDLCCEYRNNGTVNGLEMPKNICLAAFYIIDPTTPAL